MTARALTAAGTLAVIIALPGMSSSAIAGQSRTAITGKKYVVPRTPWGDPDLQGNLTNLYEVGTPFERPRSVRGPAARGCQRRRTGREYAGD